MNASAIPARYWLRVKQRVAIVEYAVKHGIKPASRRFGLERKTILFHGPRWRDARRETRAAASSIPGRLNVMVPGLTTR